MPTLGEACQLLGVSRRTLDKWLSRLQIEPARHAFDLRYFTITDEELQRVREARAQMPATAPAQTQTPGRARIAVAPATATAPDASAGAGAAVVSLVAFSRALGIPENTAKSAAMRGAFPTFTQSDAPNAPRMLDAAGQDAFRVWAAQTWQPKDV